MKIIKLLQFYTKAMKLGRCGDMGERAIGQLFRCYFDCTR